MAIECYLAQDMNKLTAKLIDLADVNGTFNPGGVKTKLRGIDAGSYSPEMGLFNPDTGDGSFRTKRRNPSVEMALQLRTQATSQDNHRLFLDRLFGLLEYPRILVYKGEGMAARKYIQTLGATTVDQLLRGGQDNYDQVARQFQDADLFLTLERQPIILGDELLSSANKADNPMLMLDQDGTNGATTGRPDLWTWRTTAGAADATPISAESCGGQNDGYNFTMAAASIRDLTEDYIGAGVAVGDVWAGQFVFVAPAGVRCAVAIQYLNTGVLVGVETVSAFVVGNGSEQRVTVVSGAAPATSNQVRLKLRVENTSGGALAVTLRRAMVEESATVSRFRVGSQAVPNDPAVRGGRLMYFWNDGDAPVPVVVQTLVDDIPAVTDAVALMLVGKRGNNGVTGARWLGDLNETRYVQAENSERGWTVTLYNDTTQPAVADDADASGDGGGASTNYVRCTHVNSPATSRRRWRASRTTKLDSLRGRFGVYARVRPPTSARQFAVQLRWAPSLSDPTTESEQEVLVDTFSLTSADTTGGGSSQAVASGFVDVRVGSFELPAESQVTLAGLALELWTRITKPDTDASGADAAIAVTDPNGRLEIDHAWLVPEDVSTFDDGVGSAYVSGITPQQVLGRSLTSPPFQLTAPGLVDPVWVTGSRPTATSSVERLNFLNEAAGWGPGVGVAPPGADDGTVLGTGRHRFTFRVNDTLSGTAHTVKVRVTNCTDDDEVAGTVSTFVKKLPGVITVEFDGVAGKAYQPFIGITLYGSGAPPAGTKGFLDVASITYESIPYLGAGEQFRTDPGDRYVAEKLDVNSAIVTTVRSSGETPAICDSGLNALSVRHDEIPIQFYLQRQNRKARTPTLATAYRPGTYEL